MYRFKSIKLYFFSIIKLFFLSIRNFYFKSKFYNKKLIGDVPSRIFYNPSTYLSASLTSTNKDFYKVENSSPELLWRTSIKEKLKFENSRSTIRDEETMRTRPSTFFYELA